MSASPLLMSDECPHCQAHWAWTGTAWLVADVHGRARTITLALPDGAPPAPLTRCPECNRSLSKPGARVTEAAPP